MSEPIGMTIEIGGTLPASLIEEFLEIVCDDLDNITGPMTHEDIEALSKSDVIRYDGTANFGLCQDLTKFCIKHQLSFVQHTEAKDEYDADVCYWKPGMKEVESFKTDSEHHPTIRVSTISPLTNFMHALIKDGIEALPRYLNPKDEHVEKLVKIGCKPNGYPKMLKALRKTLDEILPAAPEDVPVIVIDSTK